MSTCALALGCASKSSPEPRAELIARLSDGATMTTPAMGTGTGTETRDANSLTPPTRESVTASRIEASEHAPDTISHASEMAEGGPVTTDEVFDGKAQRRAVRQRLQSDTSAVTVLRGDDARSLGQALCAAVVPKVAADTPILLKPNLGGFDWFRNPAQHHGDNGVTGRTTDPEFVRGVIHCLRARGHSRITIGEGFTGKHADWQRLIAVSGYAAMAKQERVALVAMDDDGVFDVQGERPGKPVAISGIDDTHVPTLLMPRLLAWHLRHGLYISLPKLKTHRYAVFSVGIKAQQGTVMYSNAAPAFHQRGLTHREITRALRAIKANAPDARALYVASLERFAERMADVLELEAPHAVLAEGAPAMHGDGFGKLYPLPEFVAIGGTNVVRVDRVAAAFLGLWDNAELARELGGHRTSPLLTTAAKHFAIDISAPTVIGNGAALVEAGRPYHLIAMANFVIASATQATAAPATGLTAPATSPAHPATSPATSPPLALRASAITADQAPRIDGHEDAIWQVAPPLAWNTDWAGATTTTTTHVRALWQPATAGQQAVLFFRWELDAAKFAYAATSIDRDAQREHATLYTEDCVELFLAPDARQPQRYAEIEVGPFGHYFDLLIDRAARGAARSNTAWNADLAIGVKRDRANQHAVIEVAIRSAEIVAALRPDAQLAIGLFRMEGKSPRQYLAAFPTRTPTPNFHVPSAFGQLHLLPLANANTAAPQGPRASHATPR